MTARRIVGIVAIAILAAAVAAIVADWDDKPSSAISVACFGLIATTILPDALGLSQDEQTRRRPLVDAVLGTLCALGAVAALLLWDGRWDTGFGVAALTCGAVYAGLSILWRSRIAPP